MNDHVVDGEELREFIQKEYNFQMDLACLMETEERKLSVIAVTKAYYGGIAKKFKVVIDLHD